MRAKQIKSDALVARIAERVWALRIDVEPLVHVTFENAAEHGIAAEALVDQSYRECQRFADRLRDEGARGMVVPSAALPGTECVVLFGARISAPYLNDPAALVDVPASVTAERARPPVGLSEAVRFRDQKAHAQLEACKAGEQFEFAEPFAY